MSNRELCDQMLNKLDNDTLGIIAGLIRGVVNAIEEASTAIPRGQCVELRALPARCQSVFVWGGARDLAWTISARSWRRNCSPTLHCYGNQLRSL